MFNKQTLLLSTIIACLASGCELSEPFKFGPQCPGIELDGVEHLATDSCKQNNTCLEEDLEAVSLGYCPDTFTCNYNDNGKAFCQHACESGKIRCNTNCIDPLNSPTFCGAKGACSDNRESSENFMGHNCETLSTDTRLLCLSGKC